MINLSPQIISPVNNIAKISLTAKVIDAEKRAGHQASSIVDNQLRESDTGQGLQKLKQYAAVTTATCMVTGALINYAEVKKDTSKILKDVNLRESASLELMKNANITPPSKFMNLKTWNGSLVKDINSLPNFNRVIKAEIFIEKRNTDGVVDIEKHEISHYKTEKLGYMFNGSKPDAGFGNVVGYKIIQEEKYWRKGAQSHTEYKTLENYTKAKYGSQKTAIFEKTRLKTQIATSKMFKNGVGADVTRKQLDNIKFGSKVMNSNRRDIYKLSKLIENAQTSGISKIIWNKKELSINEAKTILVANSLKRVDNAKRLKGGIIKNVAFLTFHKASRSVSTSDAGEGFQMITQCTMPIKSTYRLMRKPLNFLVYQPAKKAGNFVTKRVVGRGIDIGARKVTNLAMSQLNKHGATNAAEQLLKIQNFGSKNLSLGLEKGVKSSNSNNLSKSITNVKDTTRKGLAKTRSGIRTRIEKSVRAPITKLTSPVMNIFKKQWSGLSLSAQKKITNTLSGIGKLLNNTVNLPFRLIGSITKLIRKVVAVISAFLITLILVDLMLVFLIDTVMVIIAPGGEDVETINTGDLDIGWMVDELDKEHNALTKQIRDIRSSGLYDYTYVDFNPADGEDNYKELICMTAVIYNNDFSELDKVKRTLAQLYDDTHSLTQRISSYTSYYEDEEKNKTYYTVTENHITVNIADPTTMFTRSLEDEIDDYLSVGEGPYSKGWVSRKFTSYGEPEAVIDNDISIGGTSYGLVQLSTYSNNTIERYPKCPLNSFLNYLARSYPETYKIFNGLKPNSKSFKQVWRQLGQTSKDFVKAQYAYADTFYYEAWCTGAKKQLGIDFKKSYALQEFAYSASVQIGPTSYLNNWAKAAATKISNNTNEKEIVKTFCEQIYNDRAAIWKDSDADTQNTYGERYNPSTNGKIYIELTGLYGKSRPDNNTNEDASANDEPLTSIAKTALACVDKVKYSSTNSQNIEEYSGTANVCGFTRYVYNKHGLDIGSDISSQLGVSYKKLLNDWNKLKSGDLVFFKMTDGKYITTDTDEEVVAVYVGNSEIVYMSKDNGRVISKQITESSSPSINDFYKAYRVNNVSKKEVYGSSSTFSGWTNDNIDWFNIFYSEETGEFWDPNSEDCYKGWKNGKFTSTDVRR